MDKTKFHIILPLLFALTTAENFCSTDVSSKCLCGYGLRKHTKTFLVTDCTKIGLKEVPNFIELPMNVNVLDVSNNNIQKLEWKTPKICRTLKWFLAAYNDIGEVTEEFLGNMPLLSQLDLSHNKISNLDYKVFKGVPGLHHLDLSFNSIKILPSKIFGHTQKLKFLDLSYNNLGDQLNSFDKLLNAEISVPRNITHLSINSVNITDLNKKFFHDMSIVYLSATDNNLREVPRLPKSIQFLDLSGNLFQDLNANRLDYSGLKSLILNRLSYLSKIENYAFYNLNGLERLSLDHCDSLESFNPLAFGVLIKDENFNLTSLSLDGSGLRRLNHTYLNMFMKLKSVNLANNPWYCDCHILWLNHLGGKQINKDSTQCMWPRRLLGHPIHNLTEVELPRCSVGGEWRSQRILIAIVAILFTFLVIICGVLLFSQRWRHHPSASLSVRSPYNNLIVREQE